MIRAFIGIAGTIQILFIIYFSVPNIFQDYTTSLVKICEKSDSTFAVNASSQLSITTTADEHLSVKNQSPDKIDKNSHIEYQLTPVRYNSGFDPRLDNYVIIVKTGKETLYERVFRQITTFLPKFKNIVYISDHSEVLGEEVIYNAVAWMNRSGIDEDGWSRDAAKNIPGLM